MTRWRAFIKAPRCIGHRHAFAARGASPGSVRELERAEKKQEPKYGSPALAFPGPRRGDLPVYIPPKNRRLNNLSPEARRHGPGSFSWVMRRLYPSFVARISDLDDVLKLQHARSSTGAAIHWSMPARRSIFCHVKGKRLRGLGALLDRIALKDFRSEFTAQFERCRPSLLIFSVWIQPIDATDWRYRSTGVS